MTGEKGRHEAVVKVACVQMEPIVGNKEDNIQKSIAFIEKAAGKGANLIVLPELANSGYVFENRQEAFALSEQVPQGQTCRLWAEAAARLGVYIVAGINEHFEPPLWASP